MIYVVDCHDRERIDQVKEEFQTTINDPSMLNKIILVFTNKQDLVSHCFLFYFFSFYHMT
ncbi:putative small GTPase superfamily, ARF/SAR type, P-loop containing nucleoside triphosphate hydrolase [Medicago truncatula]|uniref:Putative small GTPase superfamily, ARF/SAR type, P-loop containing nucleoside triphosphate hydrolase n=1 Tax=Medicago truncatula TaxID=3880 RepID=A0A396HJC3_MEDTR|nr:putative small GTPase superfamily, ARF/SAR type, P-loop containing nucleoside triphosphate hydrolase [Medicago truncatula]